MDIEERLLNLLKHVDGDHEFAVFYFPPCEDEKDPTWVFELSNKSDYVQLGEVAGKYTSIGSSLLNVIEKMEEILNIK